MSPAGLLTLALLVPAGPAATPALPDRGDELTYTGTVTEAIDRPGTRFRRAHELEVRVLGLSRGPAGADVAVLTLLRRTADGVVAVAGVTPDRGPEPPAARLDLIRLGWVREEAFEPFRRSAQRLAPAGPPPFALCPETPAGPLPAVPLDRFAPFELGLFPPRQTTLLPGEDAWTVSVTGRPAEQWKAGAVESVNGERCVRFTMTQQTPDWDKPVGGQTAWQRTDTIWASTRDETARRVHRVIRHRDGLGPAPAVVVEVKYELTGQTRVAGRTFDRCKREVEVGYAAAAELAALLPDAARLGARPFEAQAAKLDRHIAETDPGTPYRPAVLAVRRRLDAARRGEATPGDAVPPLAASQPAATPQAAAPDFRAGDFHLTDTRGKPVVLVFFKPGMTTTDPALTVAEALFRRYGTRAAVVPLAVYGDPAGGTADRDRLGYTVPVYDGSAAGKLYGIDTVPRFVLIDAAGAVRGTVRGVGNETGYLVRERLDGLLAPTATTSRTGPTRPPPTPRP